MGRRDWYRLVVDDRAPEQPYRQVVHDVVAERWDEGCGKRLVAGIALEQKEHRATWKTLSVTVTETHSNYRLRRQLPVHVSVPQIPERLDVTFRAEGTSGEATTWDDLKPLRLETETPESIGGTVEDDGLVEKAREHEKRCRAELTEKLRQALDRTIPRFKVLADGAGRR